ncbi:MAG: iron-containing alcohol dehydrogenase [Ruminococcaceae bacterium]|nr:iron-containing alcohol dehydrogenase [Oscillospiraceae bacterium]
MEMNFFLPTRIISGVGCVSESFAQYGILGKKAIIVTGKTGAKLSGALDDVTAVLDKKAVPYIVFDEIMENPSVAVCHKGGKIAREFGADFIIGIGGGSAIDAAKAVSAYAVNDIEPMQIYLPLNNKPLPIVAIGTTCGTGSEVTPVSVLTTEDGEHKKSFGNEHTIPKTAFCDPKYIATLPDATTVSTALDALCHGIESYFSPKSTKMTHILATNAVATVWNALMEFSMGDRNIETYGNLLYGSVMAGGAIAMTGTGFCHPMGYNYTLFKGIPHGRACAFFLAEYLRRNCEEMPEYAETIFSLLEVDSIAEFEFGLRVLTGKAPKLTEKEIEKYVELIADARNFKNAQAIIDKSEMYEIYRKCSSK